MLKNAYLQSHLVSFGVFVRTDLSISTFVASLKGQIRIQASDMTKACPRTLFFWGTDLFHSDQFPRLYFLYCAIIHLFIFDREGAVLIVIPVMIFYLSRFAWLLRTQ